LVYNVFRQIKKLAGRVSLFGRNLSILKRRIRFRCKLDRICNIAESPVIFQLLSFQASKEHLEKHYADLSKKPFFAGLVSYMASGPVVAMVWEGLNAVKTGLCL
jgi:nucleoside diphosphate kinase